MGDKKTKHGKGGNRGFPCQGHLLNDKQLEGMGNFVETESIEDKASILNGSYAALRPAQVSKPTFMATQRCSGGRPCSIAKHQQPSAIALV